MTTQLTTTQAAGLSRLANQKATIQLGAEQVAVRLDEDGFLKRVMRTLKLQFGTELYSATKNPGPADKVMPYQPGYMKLVAALGGQLTCPPAVRDPITGEMRPNPYVETYAGSGIIRAVTATAIAAARDEVTGEWHVSIQTIRVDAEHVLRQALMKIKRDDCVRILSDEEMAEERLAGKLKGWTVLPLTPPFANICANLKMEGVLDAFSTFTNLGATLRQKACTKAERLACDHNPVLRRTWEYAQLQVPRNQAGDQIGAPYIAFPVVTWVETRGKREMEQFLADLAAMQQVADVTSIVSGEAVDLGDDVIDEPEPEFGEYRALTTEAEEPVRAPVRERVPVEVTPEPVQAATKPTVQPEPTKPAAPPERRLVTSIRRLLEDVPTELVPEMMRKSGTTAAAWETADDAILTRLRDTVRDFLGGAS